MPASNRDVSDHDLGLQASQSMDCEPTPPIQRHGSKNNFFLPSTTTQDEIEMNHGMGHNMRHYQRGYINGSPHPNRQRYRS